MKLWKYLKKYENFISVEKKTTTNEESQKIKSVKYQLLFTKNDFSKAGTRHLSDHGKKCFENILFNNLKNSKFYEDIL